MPIYADTTDVLEFVLAGAPVANEWHYYANWADHTATGLTPDSAIGVSNGTTAVTAVGSPAASTQRQLKHFTLWNADTVANLVTIRFDDGTNERTHLRFLLYPGETLEYVHRRGWTTIDKNLVRKEQFAIQMPRSRVWLNPGFVINTNAAKTLTSGQTIASYIGRAEWPYSSITLKYRVTTLAASITWSEVGIASGVFNMGGNQTLTTRGSSNTGASVTSTGIKEIVVAVTGIQTGMDLYALLGIQATTPGAVRVGLGDDITSGIYSAATARPSTMAANTVFTLGANTDTLIEWAVYPE